jgi:hypothetical protein
MSLGMLKSVLATFVLLLAVGQALTMAQVRGYFKLVPLAPSRLRRWHRWGGDATLILTWLVAAICVVHMPFSTYSLRVPLHAVLGSAAALTLLVKVAMARFFRRHLRYAPILGAIAGFSVLGTFAASALWYFWWAL